MINERNPRPVPAHSHNPINYINILTFIELVEIGKYYFC